MNGYIKACVGLMVAALLLIDAAPAAAAVLMAGAVVAGKAGNWGYWSCRSCVKRKRCIEKDRKLPCGEYRERRERSEKQISRLRSTGNQRAGRCV